MRRAGILLAFSIVGAVFAAEDLTAPQLIAKVEAAQKTSGFRTRARLIKVAAGSKGEEVVQLLIKGRRQGDTTQVLYQALWPKEFEGQALVLETSADGTVGGFLFEPPARQTTLTAKVMGQSLFGSVVTVEDVAEAYWRWPHQKLSGTEMVAAHRCQVLESRPATGASGSYSLVKSWIAPDIALPLRVEKYDREGRWVKRFIVGKTVKQGPASWGAAVVVVETPDGARATLEGTRCDRDLDVPADQFTPEALKRAVVSHAR